MSDHLGPRDSDTLGEKQIELYDRLMKGQDTVVEKLEKIVELLSAIGNYVPQKEPQDDEVISSNGPG